MSKKAKRKLILDWFEQCIEIPDRKTSYSNSLTLKIKRLGYGGSVSKKVEVTRTEGRRTTYHEFEVCDGSNFLARLLIALIKVEQDSK